MNGTDAARAAAIVRDIAEGVVTERPKYRAAAVLECPKCLRRFAIADGHAAETRTWDCPCGGKARIRGYFARMDPLRKAGAP